MPDRPVVLITGVSGLIGTRLASLLASDYVVVGLDVQESPERFPDEADFFHCDLTSDASTEQALTEIRSRVGLGSRA